jgi:predicted GIY-YIG superfamily endonuclease
LTVVYRQVRFGRPSALRREAQIKRLSRAQKLELIRESD